MSQPPPKNTLKRHSWSNIQTRDLINGCKENFYEFETYPQQNAWSRVKARVDKYGSFEILFSTVLSLYHPHVSRVQHSLKPQLIVPHHPIPSPNLKIEHL